MSGRRALAPGRIGADDSDDRCVPVGTVRVLPVGLEACARDGGRVGLASAYVDCADSGRGGALLVALSAAAALFWAAMVSLRVRR
jgi:hypothetical protein